MAVRELSSRWTFFHKFLFPSIWIGGFSLGTLVMFLAPDSLHGSGDVRDARWLFAGATLAGGGFIYWACMRLKKVTLSRDSLIVSNFRDEIQVPLRDIETVSGSLYVNPELIWIEFRRPTAFGSKIVFMPKLRVFHGFTRHPMVAELRSIIANAG